MSVEQMDWSRGRLLMTTAAAAVVSFGVLVTVVAPAEYGYDPTGIGGRLGLLQLYRSAPSASVHWRGEARKSASEAILLPAGQGAEIKAVMVEGQQLLYRWAAQGGPVYLEVHGEPPGEDDDYRSYAIEESTEGGEGGITAPFEGTHGWYWKNRGESDVVIRVEVDGYFESFGKP